MSLPYFDECIEFQYAYITVYIVRSEKKHRNMLGNDKQMVIIQLNREQ